VTVTPEAAIVLASAFLAGLVDAMVGGGGLIQLPALFSAYPQVTPPSLLGTGKFAGMFGTLSAVTRYGRSLSIPWRVVAPGAALAFVTSLAGAWAVSRMPPDLFRPLVPVLLAVVFAYTLTRKDFGRAHRPRTLAAGELAVATALTAAIGFYDGFFGPGTGSFLMFMFIRLFGFDFLNASVSARVVNVATNAAALLWFGSHGNVMWGIGAGMAVCNVAGAQVGTRLALRHGSGFVRWVFIAVVGALIARTAWDALFAQGG
jgi:hypothetical protein